MISEPNLVSTFPTNQFIIKNYASAIRFRQNDRRGDILLQENTSTRFVIISLPRDFK